MHASRILRDMIVLLIVHYYLHGARTRVREYTSCDRTSRLHAPQESSKTESGKTMTTAAPGDADSQRRGGGSTAVGRPGPVRTDTTQTVASRGRILCAFPGMPDSGQRADVDVTVRTASTGLGLDHIGPITKAPPPGRAPSRKRAARVLLRPDLRRRSSFAHTALTHKLSPRAVPAASTEHRAELPCRGADPASDSVCLGSWRTIACSSRPRVRARVPCPRTHPFAIRTYAFQ